MDKALIPARWGPPRWTAVVLGAFTLALLVVATGLDGPGRVLLGISIVGTLYSGGWVLAGPALTADEEGVRVRGAVRTHHAEWAQVSHILLDSRRRSRAVELETDSGLLAVPVLLLGGVSPRAVVAELEQRRDRARGLRPG